MYPIYTLTEINCKQRTSRDLRMDVALEDQNTPAGIAARAKFFQSVLNTPLVKYPSPWESIEPSSHSYARRDFVCNRGEAAK